MNSKTAKKLLDRAIQFQIYKIAVAIAQAPEDSVSPEMPEVIELRSLVQSVINEDEQEANAA